MIKHDRKIKTCKGNVYELVMEWQGILQLLPGNF